MKTVSVTTASAYAVEIGSGLLPTTLGVRIAALCPRASRVVVLSDDTVAPLLGSTALASVRGSGFSAELYTLSHGEVSKTAQNLIELLDFVSRCRLTRDDALIALGGGVIGDMTGLAAALYMRGIAYFQVPTTLLAAVDSSVGGKTAVDLPAGKNLMGAFWQPKLVLCDTDALNTLPDAVFTDGCAEIIKTAVLFDRDLFDLLCRDGKSFDRERVIGACVEHKRDVVVRDEKDQGLRALLNFGHTLGHAAELCSSFALTHGHAVAAGMAVVSRAAANAGLCPAALPDELCALLTQFGLPITTDIPLPRLMDAMMSDKKRSGDSVRVIVPEAIGQCTLRSMTAPELQKFMETGLTL